MDTEHYLAFLLANHVSCARSLLHPDNDQRLLLFCNRCTVTVEEMMHCWVRVGHVYSRKQTQQSTDN